MKRFMILACLFALFSAVGILQPAWAAPYPDRPIEMIIPMPAGAAGDITGRLFAEELGKILNQQIVVTNKPGGSFTLGTDAVVRSKPDGYTLLYTNTSAIVYVRATEPKIVPYDPDKDLTPLGMHLYFPHAIAVKADSPWKTFKDFIDYAKQNPGKIRCSSAGLGTIASFILKVTEGLTGAQFTEVPSKGGQQVVTMLLGGHVECTVDTIGKIIPFQQSNELRMLYTTMKIPEVQDVPTMTDLGYKQDPPSAWFALYGPAGLPDDVKKVLTPAIKKAIETPALKEKFAKLYYLTNYGTPEELAGIAKADYNMASEIAEKFGFRK